MSHDNNVLKSRTLDIFNKSDEILAYDLKLRNVPIKLLQEVLGEPEENSFIGGFNVSEGAYKRLRNYVDGSPEIDFGRYEVQIACYNEDVG